MVKGTRLFYSTANTERALLLIPRALYSSAACRGHPVEMDDEQLAAAPSEEACPAVLPRQRTVLRPAEGQMFRGKNRERVGNIIQCALITRVNYNHAGKHTVLLLKLQQENTNFTGSCQTRFISHWTSEDLQCQRDGEKLRMGRHPAPAAISAPGAAFLDELMGNHKLKCLM